MLIVIALLTAAAALIYVYNRLVTLHNRVENAWSQIDLELKRRHDLIPLLVTTVRGHLTHEGVLLASVTERRAAAVAAGPDLRRLEHAEGELAGALKRMVAVAEHYPTLKADQSFGQLQRQLAETETRIAFTRQFYNDTVTIHNTALESFPGNLIAGLFGLRPSPHFQAEPK